MSFVQSFSHAAQKRGKIVHYARLASTEQIFGTPWYCSLFLDQSLVFNRRPDGQEDVRIDELKEEKINDVMEMYENFYPTMAHSLSGRGSRGSRSQQIVKASDRVTKIYGCATMWHENLEEMMEMLKSLFRQDAFIVIHCS